MPLIPNSSPAQTTCRTPGPALMDLPVAEARAGYRMMRPAAPDIAVGAVQDRKIPGPAGEIPVRIYTHRVMVHFRSCSIFHGGGWVIGDLDTADASAATLQSGRLRRRVGRLSARAGTPFSRGGDDC